MKMAFSCQKTVVALISLLSLVSAYQWVPFNGSFPDNAYKDEYLSKTYYFCQVDEEPWVCQ